MPANNEIANRNQQTLTQMLEYLGRRDFENYEKYLADDVYADWPYVPVAGLPGSVVGKEQLLAYFKGEVDGARNDGMLDFTPFNYTITRIIETVDPDQLVAEYCSDSIYLPSNTPYSNKYISIFNFDKNGLICYWREYVNPLLIYQTLGYDI